ncbi:MAG: tyrosine-type recombinase/integrase [Pseudonocardia sp.]|uniref:tyrosine-type recombinase/integrase n=1 Tax=Pseudonocardia sp. TaxID=60912 RepID=UPI001AD35208|nr:tyrosine-type recombinase/integrase [Pseudonocardia sp.]MBN9098207.1 tyrosine-type recombinase/integrase [Pseudonocardia sp.]
MAWVEQSGNRSWRVRYRREDGTIGAVNGFSSKTAAGQHADTLESEQRRGTWVDPAAGKTTLREWSVDWLDALDVAIRTEDYYRSLLRCHILPRWGDDRLADISGIKTAAWAKQLRASGYAPVTVSGVTKLLSLMLSDAVEERLIVANPIRARRRGRHRATRRAERIWATPQEALSVADNAARLPGAGPAAAVLIVTAAWTGARWGELVGLHRANTHLDDGVIVIDPDVGTLHESSRGLELGPPKTAESARTITLPNFLVELLRAHLDTHDHTQVFISPEGEWHRRSNFGRRAMRPAADGNLAQPRPHVRLSPVKTGLTFHGLRHSHKTWMIADNVPEIAQARRLGHILDDKIQQTYSHVAAEVETHLLEGLAERWSKAIADSPEAPDWRSHLGPNR